MLVHSQASMCCLCSLLKESFISVEFSSRRTQVDQVRFFHISEAGADESNIDSILGLVLDLGARGHLELRKWLGYTFVLLVLLRSRTVLAID